VIFFFGSVEFAINLESLYGSSDYSDEYTRAFFHAQAQSGSEAADLVESVPFHPDFPCADLVDFDVKNEDLSLPTSTSTPPPHSSRSNHPLGFAWFRLQWLEDLLRKDPSSRLRTLLEGLILRGEPWSKINQV
jgi:hypothetical protein